MKYLILSDIHGSFPTLQQALSFFHQQQCDYLCILGDILNYGPRNGVPAGLDPKQIAATLNDMADKIIAIRGNCDSEVDQMLLLFPILATYAVVVDEGRKILLTHGHVYNRQTLPPGRFDAVVYGHTHLWELTDMVGAEDGRHTVICNTGSITFPKGGKQPTFGIMDNGVISIRDLDNNILAEHKLT